MRKSLAPILLLIIIAVAPRPFPEPQVRGRQHFAIQGQPLRNTMRWWFGSVPVPPKPVEK